jgi:uncharacterized protein
MPESASTQGNVAGATPDFSHRARQPFHVMVKPTGPICNLECSYCFYLEKEDALPGRMRRWLMEEGTLENYIKSYIAAQPAGDFPVTFAWQGGEPTLCGLDFFKKVRELQHKYADGRQIDNALQTNGTLLDDKWCEFLAREQFLVGISIDGPADLHDKYRIDKRQRPSFDRVMRGLELLKKHGVEFNTLTCVHRGNQAHPQKVYRFLKSIGSRYLQFIPIVERKVGTCASRLGFRNHLPPQSEAGEADIESPVMHWSVDGERFGDFLLGVFHDWVRKDVGKIYVQAFDMALGKWAGAGGGICVHDETCGRAMALESDGSVYACDHYVYPEYKIGNIHEEPLAELADHPRMAAFGASKKDSLPKYCRQCPVRFACNGGCPKHRFIKTPDGEEGLNYLCPGYRKFFTKIHPPMYAMAQLYRDGRPPATVMEMISKKQLPGWN